MILPPVSKPCVIRLFDQSTNHSFVMAGGRAAVAQTGAQGRLSGRNVSASPLMAARRMAGSRSLATTVCILAIFMLSSGAALAERALSATRQATAPSTDPFAAFVAEASKRFAVPEPWIRAVMRAESGIRVRARSRKGAMGLMQIMPQTWTELRARYGFGADPYDPHDNILAGAAYIRELRDRYGAPGFLAAYNAGPGRYERYLETGKPLPPETQDYRAALAPMAGSEPAGRNFATILASSPLARSPLFVVRNASGFANESLFHGLRSGGVSSAREAVDLSALVPQSGNLFCASGQCGSVAITGVAPDRWFAWFIGGSDADTAGARIRGYEHTLCR